MIGSGTGIAEIGSKTANADGYSDLANARESANVHEDDHALEKTKENAKVTAYVHEVQNDRERGVVTRTDYVHESAAASQMVSAHDLLNAVVSPVESDRGLLIGAASLKGNGHDLESEAEILAANDHGPEIVAANLAGNEPFSENSVGGKTGIDDEHLRHGSC